MEARRRTFFAILSADAGCIGRLRLLCADYDALVLVPASDPGELLLGVVASLRRIREQGVSELAGVFLDLTAPRFGTSLNTVWSVRTTEDDAAGLAAAMEIA
ncbi:MAG: hypothetical protein ACHQ4H_17245, partial [Ktedonobacterales bacterium]